MNFRQLECFVAVVDEGSFTRAARRLGITQPSLSQHIKALEPELDGAVLDRLPRGVSLTPAGRGAAARGADSRCARSSAAGRARAPRSRSSSASSRSPRCSRWRSACCHATSASGTSATRTSRSGCTSFATATCSRTRSSRASPTSRSARGPLRRWDGPLETVGWEEFVLVVAQSDPLARRGAACAVDELREREWVLYHPDHGLAGIVEEICRARRASGRGARVRTSQAEGAVRLAAVGVGIALVPDNIVAARASSARVLRFEPRLIRDVAVYARSDWSPTAAAFVDVLRSDARPRPRGAVALEL